MGENFHFLYHSKKKKKKKLKPMKKRRKRTGVGKYHLNEISEYKVQNEMFSTV